MVQEPYSISLGGTLFPLRTNSAVIEQPQQQWAPKTSTGDTDQDDDNIRSTVGWSDISGGIGRDPMESASDVNRSWWSTHNTRYPGHMLHPPLAIGAPSRHRPGQYFIPIPAIPGGAGTIREIIDFFGLIYVVFDDKVCQFNQGTREWRDPPVVHTLPGNARSSLVTRLGDARTLTLFINCGADGYAHAHYDADSGQVVWANVNHPSAWMVWWDEQVWSMDDTGQLSKATAAGGPWTADAWLPVADGQVSNMVTLKGVNNLKVINAVTKDGKLWRHDAEAPKWLETSLDLPVHPDTGRGVAGWEGMVFISSGMAIHRMDFRGFEAIVDQIGLDQDAGLPDERSGTIVQLLRGQNSLIALVQGVTKRIGHSLSPLPGEQLATGPLTLTEASRASTILEYTGQGWQVLWAGGQDGIPDPSHPQITTGRIIEISDSVRLWWGAGSQLWYMELPVFHNNPQNLPDLEFANFAETLTPWFNAGIAGAQKVAIDALLELAGFSALPGSPVDENKVRLYVGYDYEPQWYPIYPAVPSDNPYDDPLDIELLRGELYLPRNPAIPDDRGGGRAGVTNSAIRFLIQTWLGYNIRQSPDPRSLTYEYYKRAGRRQKFEYLVSLDLALPYNLVSAADLRARLKKMVKNPEMVPFEWEGETIYVKVFNNIRTSLPDEDTFVNIAELTLIEI